MYKEKEIIAIIPARGGSKGIPRKNITNLGGFPLIAWTILRSLQSHYIDRTVLSSDDNEIINISKGYNCEVPFVREKDLASDNASSVDVVLDVLNRLGYSNKNQYFILLQPTSPFRTTESIDKCIEFTINNNFNYVMSVNELQKSPYHMYFEESDFLLKPIFNSKTNYTRRQDLPNAVVSNGAIYLARVDHFFKIKSFKPDTINYFKMTKNESIDIDTTEDLHKAINFVKKHKLKP